MRTYADTDRKYFSYYSVLQDPEREREIGRERERRRECERERARKSERNHLSARAAVRPKNIGLFSKRGQ